jgi:hypothetical protein
MVDALSSAIRGFTSRHMLFVRIGEQRFVFAWLNNNWKSGWDGVSAFAIRCEERYAKFRGQLTYFGLELSPAFLCGGLDADVQAGSRGESNEHFKTELLPFSSYQVGHPGLADPKEFGYLSLRQFLGFDDFPQIGHEISTHLKDRSFISRKAHIEEYVAGRADSIFTHNLSPGRPSSILRIPMASRSYAHYINIYIFGKVKACEFRL